MWKIVGVVLLAASVIRGGAAELPSPSLMYAGA